MSSGEDITSLRRLFMFFKDRSRFNCKLLGKKTQGNPMFSVFYRVYFHLSFVYQILFDFGFDRGALSELRLWKELFH